MSFVREYFENGPHQTSMEWAILPYDKPCGPDVTYGTRIKERYPHAYLYQVTT
jgi:hypothetical protein